MFVKMVMAGLERTVPRSMMAALKSLGWKEVQGANPVVEKADETKTRQAPTRKKKEAAK